MAGTPQAPQGSDVQVGSRFMREHFVPGSEINIFRRVKSVSGFVAARPRERTENMDPSNQMLQGVNVSAKLDALKFDLNPDVDSMLPFRAHHVGAYDVGAQLGGAEGPYPWTFEPPEPGDAAPDDYVDSMDHEITDGDGYPVLLYESLQQDLEIKISDGKIQSVAEGWMACFDTYADEALLIAAATYTGFPSLIGHFATSKLTKLPLVMRVTDVAGVGFDGKAKFALFETGTGTITTDGDNTVVGVGTSFDTSYAVGDRIQISGESEKTITAIGSATTMTVSSACSTSTAGHTFKVAHFAGTAIAFTFDNPIRVVLGDGSRAGISRFDDLFVIIPSGEGAVAAGDMWSWTTPRVLADATYSERNPLHAAGVEVVIDGTTFGGAPGVAGFHGIDIKVMRPRKLNTTTGSKYAQGVQRNGPWSITYSFDRDRCDRTFLEKLIQADTISVKVSMYGDPFGDSGYDELWQFESTVCEIAGDVRDVATANTLPEKIDVNGVRGSGGNPIFTETLYASRNTLEPAVVS